MAPLNQTIWNGDLADFSQQAFLACLSILLLATLLVDFSNGLKRFAIRQYLSTPINTSL